MKYRVGRLTLAITLIVVGLVLVYDNIMGSSVSWTLFRLWPALLIMLGVEWIAASSRPGQPAQVDGGAIALLIIGAILVGSFSAAWRTVRTVRTGWGGPRVSIFHGPFASDDVVTTYEPEVTGLTHLIISGGSAAVTVEPGDRLHLEFVVRATGLNRAEAEARAREARLRIETGPTTTVGMELPTGSGVSPLAIRVVAPKAARLTISTSSGAIEVAGWGADLTLSSSSGSIQVEEVVGRVDLRASSGSISAREIRGPVSALSSSGSIRMEEVDGDVEASATSGSVTITEATGAISAHSSSGTVLVDSDQVGGDYDLGAVSGSVRVRLPDSAGVTVDARTSSGEVSGPPWLRLGEGRGSATGQLGDGRYRITLRSTSGSISIQTP